LKKKGKVFIGTSGWNYGHWSGKFFPEDLPKTKWFNYYHKRFDTVELNTSFYHLPRKTTFEKWYNESPSGFIFSIKASRYITHVKKLNEPEEPVNTFFSNAEGIKEKGGVILFQLPPGLKYNKEKLENTLNVLPKNYRYTFEFRNDTWWNDEAYELLRKNNIAFCLFELAGKITPRIVTADYIYIRLHGPGGKYAGSYSDEVLAEWAAAFREWKSEGKDVYCYFDNDDSAYAVYNALTLKKMMTEVN
jgi:uncharacterized protein YecE (DUF72 family)